MALDIYEGTADIADCAERAFRVVGSAVPDAEEIRKLARGQFIDAVSLVRAENLVEKLAHLWLVAGQTG